MRNAGSNFPLFLRTLEEHLKRQIQDPRNIERFFQVWSRPASIAGKHYVTSLCKISQYLQKYVLHLFQFLENDYLDDKLWFCSKIQNPTFWLHGYFNKLKVISIETLINALKYLSNHCKQIHAGLIFQHSCSIPTEQKFSNNNHD